MPVQFSDRIENVNKSFIREILKVTANPDVISFAGGLPNPSTFPVDEINTATQKVLGGADKNVLQYSTTEGYLPLREYISDRYYKKQGLEIKPEDILITNGSQQGLDLIGKVFLNKGDSMIIERPGYLGAIQAFSMYEPMFRPVNLLEDGIDVKHLKMTLESHKCRLLYSVPNFQNPSGITYSLQKRKDVADLLKNHDTVFIEDNPYGELRFMGKDQPSLREFIDENIILLGSFSKIVAPGMRLGWIVAEHKIMEKLIIAKQASDLHSNYFAQRVVHQYLADNDIDRHIAKIRTLYKKQRECMVAAIEIYFPGDITFTRPEGGMFLWVTLPEGMSAMKLFELSIADNVAFVPGDPFYTNDNDVNTLRLNYTNSTEDRIEEGIQKLAASIKSLYSNKSN